MELVNALYAYREKAEPVNAGLVYEAISKLLLMLAPFTPHITEELWHDAMGSETSIHKETWPTYDPEAIKVDEVEVLIQVNGKGKDRIMTAPDISKDELGKLALGNAVGQNLVVRNQLHHSGLQSPVAPDDSGEHGLMGKMLDTPVSVALPAGMDQSQPSGTSCL